MQLSTDLPYSSDVLGSFIRYYHAGIWPAQIAALILLFLLIWALARPFPQAGRVIAFILAVFWGWCGYVFYIREFANLSFLAPHYGTAFLIQAGLLVVLAAWPRGPCFQLERDTATRAGLGLMLCGILIYPGGIALYEGSMQGWRLAGVTPVATTLLTAGVVSMLRACPFIRGVLLIIPGLHLLAAGISAWLLL